MRGLVSYRDLWYNEPMPSRKLPPNETIVSLYRAGESSQTIANRFGVKKGAVLNCLRRIGEPRRSIQEAIALRDASGRQVISRYWQGKKQPPEMVEKRIAKIRGKNHWLWKGGKERRGYRGKVPKESCISCGGKMNLGIHHKDFDHYNDQPENLQVLCVSCHSSLHKQAYWDAVKAGRTPPRSNGPIGWNRYTRPAGPAVE